MPRFRHSLISRKVAFFESRDLSVTGACYLINFERLWLSVLVCLPKYLASRRFQGGTRYLLQYPP